MDKFDATEQAFINGYSAGYKDGRQSAIGGDVTRVVRCKDCKHYEDFHGKMFCTCGANQMAFTNPDDFCSYGERREGE